MAAEIVSLHIEIIVHFPQGHRDQRVFDLQIWVTFFFLEPYFMKAGPSDTSTQVHMELPEASVGHERGSSNYKRTDGNHQMTRKRGLKGHTSILGNAFVKAKSTCRDSCMLGEVSQCPGFVFRGEIEG